MIALYDRDGILRFVNSDKDACLDYAELFEIKSTHFCLINFVEREDKEIDINFDLNQVKNNN